MLFELQQTINYYLSMICDGYIQVELKPFTMLKSKKEQWVETIDKKIFVHNAQGSWTSRIYSQLSGGQRRRVGVALALAFHDIGIRRCGFRCNLLVMKYIETWKWRC
jgi:ABC-type dipeptide/oligopeptide/nickel transport system ATPase subunit